MSAEKSINEAFQKIWIRLAVLLTFFYFAIYLPGQKNVELRQQLEKKETYISQTQSMLFAVNDELNRLTGDLRQSSFYRSELSCLADNIYYESRGEPVEGQLAVATVTVNRVLSSEFPNTICDVVHQKTYVENKDKTVCQFSWTCQPVAKPNKKVYNQIKLLAEQVMFENYQSSLIKDALFFHSSHVNPQWTELQIVAKIGNHIFYREIE